jgi:hypothetical protein
MGNHNALVTRAYDLELLINKRNFAMANRRKLLKKIFETITELQLRTGNGAGTFDRTYCEEKIFPRLDLLVFYNIGLREGNIEKAIIIDWDLYGAVDLPMYDLFLFLRSFMNFFEGSLYAKSDLGRFVHDGFLQYCNTFGLDARFTVELYPVCILLYSKLRAGTGVRIGQANALNELRNFFNNKDKFLLNTYDMRVS